MKRRKGKIRPRKLIIIFLILLPAVYFGAVDFLLAAATKPAFNQKLTLLDTITDKCLAQQVYSDDIQEHIAASQSTFDEWLESTHFTIETVETEDGLTLDAARMDAEESSHLWCLMLHGYCSWKEEMYSYARLYYSRGFNCIIPDLRAQGDSEGTFIGMGWLDHYDCMLWIDRILEIDPEAEIVIHGQSMGSATALMMTGEEDLSDHVKVVVSDCAFTDAYSMFRFKLKEWFHLPSFPILDTANAILQIRAGYNLKEASALEAVKKSRTPTIFIHGTEDQMIPVEMAYELYDAETADKDLLIVEGAGHAQSNPKDPVTYNTRVFQFISEYMDGF